MLSHFDQIQADFKQLAKVKITPDDVAAYVAKVFSESQSTNPNLENMSRQ